MTEVEQPPQNGIDPTAGDDDENSKARPADIEQDMREMERRKRVEAIMGSKLFREELERIVDSARDGGAGASGILQQLSDIVGVPVTRVGNVFKSSSCMVPINDIRGVESMGYAKGEKILRCKLAATFRLLDLYGWTQGLGAQITARLKVDQEYFLVNPYGLLYHEITASALNKVDMQGQIVEQGTTNFGVNKSHFVLHSVVHAARPDIRCAIYIGCSPVVAISSLKSGLLALTKDACVLGEISTHAYTGLFDEEERNRLVRSLGPNSKVMLLANHGALCCGETIEEAFYAACHIVQACETQLKLLPVGIDNLVLIPEESRKLIYDQSRRPPEDLEKKFAAVTTDEDAAAAAPSKEEAAPPKIGSPPKWRVGGAEFEALMRMLDNAGYRTGYIYRHPLIKSDPPKPKNDVELPPAVSSLGYLLEEEELFRQGIWKKGDLRKGGDRSRWLNSPNVYQKVEVLETGTPDPKKITKWVAEGSPTHSTPVRIEDPLQFVPAGTTTKEFKRVQQQIKDNRRADKISAGPQSHILEGVTWDEANRIKDATVSQAGDHVVLMGAASKGIIQRGFQHNATVYKAPYAKNPFDNVTDDELNEYKRTVERKKKSIHGEYTDTDFSESEALNSMQAAGAHAHAKHAQSEPETEHQVIQIQTQQAPIPSQAEVVLSDALGANLALKYDFLYAPRHRFFEACVVRFQRFHANVIYKLNDTTSRKHSYPPPPNINIVPENFSTPIGVSSNHNNSSFYRTASHYGFNSPLRNTPNILLHPANESIWLTISQQRKRVISFIDQAVLSFANRKVFNALSTRLKAPPIKEEQPTFHVTAMNFKLQPYNSRTQSPKAVSSADDSLKSQFTNVIASTPLKPEHDDGSLYATSSHTSRPSLPENHAPTKDAGKKSEGKQGDDSLDELTAQFHTELVVSRPRKPERDDDSLYLSSYTSRSFLPDKDTGKKSEAKQANDSLDELTAQFQTELVVSTPRKAERVDDSIYLSSYTSRSFLPKDTGTGTGADKSEAKQGIVYQNDGDSGMGDSRGSAGAGRRPHLTTTSNDSSSHEAEAYSQGKHIRLTLSSSTDTDSQLKPHGIDILINISLRDSERAQMVQEHELEFRCKLEKVIDDEIHYISQQLLNRNAHLTQARAPLSTPTSSTLHLRPQRSNSAPDLSHSYSYVQLSNSEVPEMPPPSTAKSESDALQDLFTSMEIELNHLLNNILCIHALNNRAIIYECRALITQLRENFRGGEQKHQCS